MALGSIGDALAAQDAPRILSPPGQRSALCSYRGCLYPGERSVGCREKLWFYRLTKPESPVPRGATWLGHFCTVGSGRGGGSRKVSKLPLGHLN